VGGALKGRLGIAVLEEVANGKHFRCLKPGFHQDLSSNREMEKGAFAYGETERHGGKQLTFWRVVRLSCRRLGLFIEE